MTLLIVPTLHVGIYPATLRVTVQAVTSYGCWSA